MPGTEQLNDVPAKRGSCACILDVGCGQGESLDEEIQRRPKTQDLQPLIVVGIDIDLAVLRRGKANLPDIGFVCAKGEELPFRDGVFDVIISRVAMPYMDIPTTLQDMRRVLKTGGEVKLKLHPFAFTLSELSDELLSGSVLNRLKNLIYRIYVICNSIALHLGGFNFRFPLGRRRCESFQTKKGIAHALTAAGFVDVNTSCWDTAIVRPHAGNCRASARRSA